MLLALVLRFLQSCFLRFQASIRIFRIVTVPVELVVLFLPRDEIRRILVPVFLKFLMSTTREIDPR